MPQVTVPGENDGSMTAGQAFVKKLRPIGCAVFLLLLACFLLLSFLSGKGNVLDVGSYAVPDTLDVSDADALGRELESALLPLLPGNGECSVQKGRLHLTFDSAEFSDCRATVLHFYPDCGIQFHRAAE